MSALPTGCLRRRGKGVRSDGDEAEVRAGGVPGSPLSGSSMAGMKQSEAAAVVGLTVMEGR
jgi:hypothetical protein